MARAALLYTLGYAALLRDDGSIPKAETDEGVTELFAVLASQPVARQTQAPLVTNQQGQQNRSATILGMTVEIAFEGSDELTVVAEVVLASIEAFLATAIDQDVCPHTERFQIEIRSDTTISKPEIETRPLEMATTVRWPAGLRLNDYSQAQAIRGFFTEVAGQVLGTTCMVKNVKALLDKLYVDEAVGGRMATMTAAVNSYHRIASRDLSRLTDWQEVVRKEYPLHASRPQLKPLDLKPPSGSDNDDVELSGDQAPRIRSHRAFRVRSVIDVHTWDRAGWMGNLYLEFGDDGPPGMALLFKDEEAARKIFERWRERFGTRDANEEIHIAIIQHLPGQPPSHYVVLVTSRLPDKEEFKSSQALAVATRSLTMTPDTAVNLQRFLDSYQNFGGYYLLPAVMKDGQPVPISKLTLIKRALAVKDASKVRQNDIESIALRIRGYESGAPED